jgi:hypothetical protein
MTSNLAVERQPFEGNIPSHGEWSERPAQPTCLNSGPGADHRREQGFRWAEYEYRSGGLVVLIAPYEKIPADLRSKADQLVVQEYRRCLFETSLFGAALQLLAANKKSSLAWIRDSSQNTFRSGFSDELQRGINYITRRSPKDIVLIVLGGGEIIFTMTLFPFKSPGEIPSRAYLSLDPILNQLPNASAIEIGRLAKRPLDKPESQGRRRDLVHLASTAAAFRAGRDFVIQKGLVDAPDSYICGTTANGLVTMLKSFFPLQVVNAKLNPEIFEEKGNGRGMAIYFLQRQVLGSFESVEELFSRIDDLRQTDPKAANDIMANLQSGLKNMGVSGLNGFRPQKFVFKFFHFPFHHPDSLQGFRRMEKVVDRFVIKRSGTGLRLRKVDAPHISRSRLPKISPVPQTKKEGCRPAARMPRTAVEQTYP